MEVKVKKLVPEAKLPTRATCGSACYDVYSTRRVLFSPMEKVTIPTGLAFELPDGVGLDIRPRSGLASRGLIMLNSPGTLDSDYRGELKVSFMNLHHGNILISEGDRIAQVRLIKPPTVDFIEVKELSETERGKGGFGSTGK